MPPKASETIERGHELGNFDLSIKEDGLWLIRGYEMINLGHPDDVFEKFAAKMAEVDYGEG